MAKVKKCLDAGCTRYILLDDNRCIIEPKDKCDFKSVSDNFLEEYKELSKQVTGDTIYTSKELFKKVKEGEELRF
jgi:hypothetical protein